MKVVIEIPDFIYDTLIKTGKYGFYRFDAKRAIRNGTPLPKGHGELIDYGYVVDAIDDWVNAEEYRYTNSTDYLRNRIKNVPTIIEADTESEDKE